MSGQIATSLQKSIVNFISQIDGQKPVSTYHEMQQMSGSYRDMAEESPSSIGHQKDVSQQIMETHGQRIKKYGIYID